MKVGSLELEMFANVARIQSDINRMNSIVSSGAQKMSDAAAMASRALGAIGVGLSAGALVAFVKNVIDAADRLNDMSQRVGIAVKELAAYKLAADQSGTSLEAIAKGVKGLAGNMVEHSAALKAAGITATTADGAMRQLADVFAKMPDGIEKTALVTKLFGKAGMDLIPMLNMGSRGLDESAEKSAKYAAAMALLAPQADKFNDSMAEIGINAQLVGVTLANKLMPQLTEISGAMAIAAHESGILMAAWVGLGGVLDSVFGKPRTTISDLAQQIKATEEAMAKVAQSDPFKAAKLESLARTLATLNAERDKLTKPPAGADNNKPAGLDIEAWKKQYKALYDAIGEGGDKGAKAYEALQKKAAEYIKTLEKETAQAGLSAIQKKAVEASMIALTLHTNKEREAVMAAFAAWASATQAAEDHEAEVKALAKAEEEYAKAVHAMLGPLEDEARNLERQVETYGQTRQQIELNIVARMEEAKAIMQANGASEDAIRFYEREIEARKSIVGSSARLDQLKAESDMWKTIEDSAKQTWVSIFDSGKSAFDRLRDTLKNGLYALLWEMSVKKWVISIGAAIGVPGAAMAQTASSSASMLNSGSSLYSLGSNVAGWLGLGAAAPSLAMSTGGAVVGGVTYAGSIGASVGASGVGSLAGAAAAAGEGGLMASAAAAGPYVLAAIAAASALGLFGKKGASDNYYRFSGLANDATTSKTGWHGGPYGEVYDFYGSGGSTFRDMPADTRKGIDAAITSLFTSMGKLATGAGLSTTALDSLVVSVHSTGKGIQADFEGAIAETAAAIAETLLPNIKDFQANGETLDATLQRLISDAAGVRGVFDTLGLTFSATGAEAVTLSEKIIAAFGGSSNLAAAMQSYNQNYYSEAERTAQTAKQLQAGFAAINLTMPTTREAFREMVTKAAADMSDTGIITFTALMRMQEAFASITPAATTATAAVIDNAAALKAAEDAAKAIANERYGLETQLLQVQGKTADLRARELALLDESNRPLQQQIWDLQDKAAASAAAEQAAQQQAAAEAQAAQQQAQAQQQIRDGWQRTADSVLGTIQKLRGDLAGGGAQGFAQAQADFALATAAARAGDQTAAGKVSALALSAVDLHKSIATTSLDQSMFTAWVMDSLQTTARSMERFGISVPSYDVGTNYVPRDGLAMVHEGEAIIPKARNPAAGASASDNDELRAEFAELRRSNAQMAADMRDLKNLMVRVTRNGDSMVTTSA